MALHGQASIPNGRPPQPSAALPASPPVPGRRVGDALQIVQDEYNRILAERDALRHELARIQNVADEQDFELNLIKRAIWNLQNQLEHHRHRFEEERRMLFEELRQQRAAAGLAPPSPLRELSNSVLSAPSSSHIVIQIPEHNAQREQEAILDRKMKERAREHPEIERDEYREPKRMRSNDVPRGSSMPILSPAPPYHPYQPRITSGNYPAIHGNNVTNAPNGHSHPTPIPPHISKTAAPPMPDELTLDNVPPEYRKNINGQWIVSFNPKLPRNIDVEMIRSIPHPSVVCSIHFSADGRYVATGCNQVAYIYDICTGAQVCALLDPSLPKGGDLYIRSVRFSPDGEYLATGAEDQQVRVWNIKHRSLRHVFAGHTNEIYALDYSRNGNFVVSGSADRTARVWDLRGNNHKVFKIDAADEESGITSISISPNNRYVAAGCLDRLVRIWDLETGALAAKLHGHRDSVYTVRFTPDGRKLVSGSLDYTVKLWDASALVSLESHPMFRVSCPLISSVRGHQDYVLTVACSSDSRWIASGAKDRGLMFWDPVEGLARFKLYGHTNSVISIDIHGPYIATASGDMCCRIWAFSVNGN